MGFLGGPKKPSTPAIVSIPPSVQVKPADPQIIEKRISILVRQVPANRIHEFCKGGGGCYDTERGIITVPTINGWTDTIGIESLGHEVYHALGYHHD